MSIVAAARKAIPHLSDYTDQEIMDAMATIDGVKPGSKAYKKLESEALGYDRGAADAVKDAGAGMGQAILSMGKVAGMGYGALMPKEKVFDNPVTQYMDTLTARVEKDKSQGLRNREAGAAKAVDVAERTAAGEGAGFWGQVGSSAAAQAGNYAAQPALAVQDAVANIPQLLGPAAIGRGLQAAGKMVGLGQKAAARVALGGAVGAGGVMQGGDVGQETYTRLRAAGVSHEEATPLAMEAAAKAGAATVAMAALPLGSTIERSMLTGAGRMSPRLGLGAVAGRAAAGAVEAGTEAVEEGYGQYTGNQGVAAKVAGTNLASGVGSAAVQGAVVAGPMGAATYRPRPRTATGEIDLTGTPVGPTPLDEPTWSRRGLDPLNERSSPYPNPQQQTADLAAQQTGDGVIMVGPDGVALPPQSPQQMANREQWRQYQEGIPTLTDVLAPADGIPVLNDVIAPGAPAPTMADVANPTFSPMPTEPAQYTDLVEGKTQEADPTGQNPVVAPVVNKGAVLAALAKASASLNKATVKKDGSLPNTRAAAPLRQVLESKDPLAAIRQMHEDGNNTRDELLDAWHKQLTGKTVFEFKAEAAPATNSAGFVPEPAAQVQAQVDAVRDGRKDVAVLGAQEAEVADFSGLESAVVTDATGASAVVVSMDAAKVKKAKARAKKVGLKVAMGEALGVANPTLTTEANPDAAMVQQVDDQSGQVIAEELATPADAQNVTMVDGATVRVVSPEQALANRQAAAPVTPPKEKSSKGPRLGKKTAVELVEMAETSKDENEYQSARYELYKRWSDHGDAVAEAYLNNKKNRSDMKKDEKTAFELRYQAELKERGAKKSQQLGKKFGAKMRAGGTTVAGVPMQVAQSIADTMTAKWENAPQIEVVASMVDLPAELQEAADGNPVQAFYWQGKVWIVAANHSSAADVVVSVLHEVTGHHGLAGLLGANLKATMRAIYNGNPEIRKAADAMVAGEGLSIEVAVEEVLADAAEQGRVTPTVVEKIGNTVRQMLRAIGLGRFAGGVSNGEVKQIIANARAFVEEGDVVAVAPAAEPKARERAGPFERANADTVAALNAEVKGKEVSSKLLSVMMLRQIAEQYSSKLPALNAWVDAIMARGAKASALASRADRIAVGWEQDVKSKTEREALADIFLRASDAEVELDNRDADYLADLTVKQKGEHASLNRKLAALSPEAQRVRKEVLQVLKDQWKYTRSSLESFINHTVADPQLRHQRIEDLKHEMGRNRGDYFPFARFGERIVIARGAASDGRDIVSFFESEAAANAAVVAHVQTGVKRSNVTVTLKSTFDAQARASGGFVGNMHQMIDNAEGADAAAKQELHEALQQLFLRSMPELSGAKAMIRRENVEGYSRDALRVFADSVTRGARYASHLEFAPTIRAAQEAAEQQTRSSDKRVGAVVIGRKDGAAPRIKIVEAGTDRLNAVNSLEADGFATEFFNAQPETLAVRLAGSMPALTPEQVAAHVEKLEGVVGRAGHGIEDMRAAKALYNHMIELQNTRTKENKVVDAMGQAGHFWFLGFSPSNWGMNLLQNPQVGLPILGAKYGMARSTGEMLNTAKWFATLRMTKLFTDRGAQFSVEWMKQEAAAGRLKGINKQELDMLQALQDRQILDFTQAMDLARMGQASSSAKHKFLKLAAAGAHHTEVFNRVTFALAAYRLAMKSDTAVTHADAVRRTESDVVASHYDYSPANAPLLLRNNLAKTIFMFQKYRQHQLYWWATNIKAAIKNESPAEQWRARKACMLMGTTQLVFGGMRALPFVGAIAFLANMFGGTDDEGVPFDFNQWISTAAKDLMGDTLGEGFAQGIFGAMGMSLATRIGQGGLLLNSGSEQYERNADDKMRAYLFDLAGPVGSMALGTARAYEAFGRGDVVAGLAATTPKFMADALKAYQLDTQGVIDKKGIAIADSEEFDATDVLMQSLGVMPRKVADLKADGARVSKVEQGLKDRTTQLTHGFVEAWAREDREGMMESVEAIKEFNATMAEKYQAKQFLIDGRRLESAVKDYQSRAVIRAVTSGSAATQRQMLIASKMDTLNAPVTDESIRRNAGELRGIPGLPGLGR